MRRTALPAATAIMAIVLLGGCAEDADQPAACGSLDAVQASLDNIRNANYGENGLAQLRTDLAGLRARLEQLAADARAQFPQELATVRSAAEQVAQTVDTARSQRSATSIAAVRTAMTGLRASVQDLGGAMAGTC